MPMLITTGICILAHACLTLQQRNMLNKTNNTQLKQQKAREDKRRYMLSSRAILKQSI